jgi:hypothetical protein
MTLEAKAINVTQPRHSIPAVASPIFQNAFCGVFGRSLVCMDIPPATYGLIPYPNPLNGLQEFVARLVFQPNFEYFSGSIPLTHPANSILHSTLFCSNGSGGVVDNPAQPLQANKAFTIVLGTPSPVAEAPITACVTFSQYPCWTPGKSYTKGSIVTPRFPNGYIYQATANFISGPNEPGYYDIPEDKNTPDSLDIIHAWSENIGETVPNDSNTLESWVNIGFDVIDVKKVVSDAVISDRGGPYEVELNYTGGILYLFVTDFSDGKTYLSQQSVGANQPLFQGWYESLLIGGEPPQGDSILLAQNENAPGVFSGYIDSVQFSTVATNHTSLQTYSKPTQPYSGGCFLMNWNRWTAGGCMYAPEAGQVVTGGQQYSCRGNETSSPPYITGYTANFHFELAYLKIFNYGVDVFNTLTIYVHDLEQSFGPLKLRCCYDSEVKNIVITGGFAVFCGLYVGYNANLTISNVAVNGGNMAYYIGSPCDVRSTVCESQYRFGLIANIDGNYGSLTVSRVSIGNESQLGWHYTSLMGIIGVSTVQGDIVLDQHLTGSTHPIFNFSALVDGGGIASNINLQLGYAIIPTSASPDFWFDLNNPPYFSNFNISSLRPDLTTHGGSMNDNRMSRVNGVGRPYTITTAGVVTGFNTISTDSLRTQASDATVFTGFYPGSGQGRLTIFDVNGYGFGLANSSAASQATYQILTQNGADLVGLKSAELIYDSVSSIWRVLNTYPLPGSGAAPTVVSVDTINLWDAAGGQTVHITGTNFITNATFAKIGEGAYAQYVSVSVSSSTTGTFVTPANMSGNGGAIGTSAALDLTIITNNGSATLNSAVWYLPAGISNYYRADQGLSGTTWVDQVSTGGINAVLNKPAVINANYAGSSLPSLSTAGGTIHATIALPPVLQPFTLAAVASSTSTATRSLLFDSLDPTGANRAGVLFNADQFAGYFPNDVSGFEVTATHLSGLRNGTVVTAPLFVAFGNDHANNSCQVQTNSFWQGGNTLGDTTWSGLSVGVGFDGVSLPFDGEVAFVAVWRRFLLPQSGEVENLYKALKATYPQIT